MIQEVDPLEEMEVRFFFFSKALIQVWVLRSGRMSVVIQSEKTVRSASLLTMRAKDSSV
jgi:hypothetical protein